MQLSGDITRHSLGALVVCVACSQGTETTGIEVISPSTETLSLETTAIAGEVAGPTGIAVGLLGTFVASEEGLFLLTGRTWTLVDTTPTRAVADWTNLMLVAREDGLFVYDGTFEPSSLSADLDGPLHTIARRGDTLWISHAGGVDEIRDGRRNRWWDTPVDVLRTYDEASSLLLINNVDAHLLDIDNRAAATLVDRDVYLAAGNRVFSRRPEGVAERVLFEDGEVAWRTVVLSDDEAPLVATAAAVVPNTGATWWATETSLVRIDSQGFLRIGRTDGLGTITWMGATADGSIWLTNGRAWARAAPDEPRPAVTWADDIASFSASNCERCHIPLGTSFPLDTYEQWVSKVDNIIDVLATGRMPLDGQPLIGGDVELIEQWKQDGLQ
ncbi:MAG: hypothetical protein AAF449_04350 [Myxococcota bacterium]